jgi:hypothetical protein
MITETELETRLRIAEARLGVAEELRWFISPLAGIAAQQFWHSWPLSAAVAIIAIFAVPYPFSKAYDKAQDEHEKFTGTGKYWRPKEPNQQPPEPPSPSGTVHL